MQLSTRRRRAGPQPSWGHPELGQVNRLRPPRRAWRESHLTTAELEKFRGRLLHIRQRLTDDISRLQRQTLEAESPSGDPNDTDEEWENLLMVGCIDNKRSLVRKIDLALRRISNKQYGICITRNELISKSRLEEVPWAVHCAACASEDRG